MKGSFQIGPAGKAAGRARNRAQRGRLVCRSNRKFVVVFWVRKTDSSNAIQEQVLANAGEDPFGSTECQCESASTWDPSRHFTLAPQQSGGQPFGAENHALDDPGLSRRTLSCPVSRRIVDRRVLHLIRMWLDCPVG